MRYLICSMRSELSLMLLSDQKNYTDQYLQELKCIQNQGEDIEV